MVYTRGGGIGERGGRERNEEEREMRKRERDERRHEGSKFNLEVLSKHLPIYTHTLLRGGNQ